MIEPAHLWIPERLGSYGDEAIDLSLEAGWDLDAEQKLAVDAKLSYGPGGRWAALESVIIESRQNGKTARILQPVTLFDLFLLPPDRIVWTAHLFRTSRDSFEDFDAAIERTPILSRRVKRISKSHGEEFIELHPPKRSHKSDSTRGAKLEFLARSGGGGRGLGGKRVVMDEALILDAGPMGALLPTLSARPDAHIDYGSSAGKATSTQLDRLVKRGRKGGDPSLIYVEFCAPGSWDNPPCELGKQCPHVVGSRGCALDNEDYWRQANHSLGMQRANGSGIGVEFVRSERRALPPREFGRERLGWHEAVLHEGNVLDMGEWGKLADGKTKATDPVGLALEINNDRAASAISVAGLRADKDRHVEVVKSAPGVSWVVDDVVCLNQTIKPCAIVIDAKSEAASLIPAFKERGLTVTTEPKRGTGEIIVLTSATDMARACGSFYTGVVEEKNIRHLNQSDLNESLAGAVWRPLGDARAWSRKEARANPAPLISVTLALHGLLTYGPQETVQPFFVGFA